MTEANKGLRMGAHALMDAAGAYQGQSLKELGTLRTEQTAEMADEKEKMGTILYQEKQSSKEEEQKVMHKFESGAAQLHQEQDALAQQSAATTDTKLRISGENAAAAARHREAAA